MLASEDGIVPFVLIASYLVLLAIVVPFHAIVGTIHYQ